MTQRNLETRPSSREEMMRATSKEAMRDRVGTRKGKTKGPVPGKLKRYDGRAIKDARHDRMIRTFYDEIDLPEFKTALELAEDPRMKMFFYALSSPKMHEHSFAELCKRCKLTLAEISDLYRRHQMHRGMVRMMNRMPQVMEDAAAEAETRLVLCSACDGTGKTPDLGMNRQQNSICPECHGDGKLRLPGDKDARALVFEAVGLRKGAGQSVNVVQVNQLPSFEEATRFTPSFGGAETTVIEAETAVSDPFGEGFGPETPKNDDETQKLEALPVRPSDGGSAEVGNVEISDAEERSEGGREATGEAERPDGGLSDLFGGPDPIQQLAEAVKNGN